MAPRCVIDHGEGAAASDRTVRFRSAPARAGTAAGIPTAPKPHRRVGLRSAGDDVGPAVELVEDAFGASLAFGVGREEHQRYAQLFLVHAGPVAGDAVSAETLAVVRSDHPESALPQAVGGAEEALELAIRVQDPGVVGLGYTPPCKEDALNEQHNLAYYARETGSS